MEIIKYISEALHHHQPRDRNKLDGDPQCNASDDQQIGKTIEHILKINLAKKAIQKIRDKYLNQKYKHPHINKKLQVAFKKLPRLKK